jgi:hypothetical protein
MKATTTVDTIALLQDYLDPLPRAHVTMAQLIRDAAGMTAWGVSDYAWMHGQMRAVPGWTRVHGGYVRDAYSCAATL